MFLPLAATAAAAGFCGWPYTSADADPSPANARFLGWAATPPMGWNSWDAFGTTLTEAQAREQADFMAAHLLPHGWRILTVDIQWYEPGASGHSYRADAPLTMDEWGRLLPAPNRFPSAAGGAGFRPLADYVHAKGLQLGIHLMRGVPRLAVARKLSVKGTSVTAAEIADPASVCPWNPDMFGVDMAKPGAQAYYDSVFELIASWGVDFVKVDDISRPYHEHEPEIEAIRRAIDRTGRPIVLSLSPGETALTAADHVQRHANLWRISDDFWDTWPALLSQFGRLARWSPHRGPGHWPDADMLPLGVLELGRRSTRFTPDEQRTLMTLWSIARSPLIHGGDMTKTDADTLRLLTNDEVIAVDQHSEGNRPLFDHDGLVAWTANVPGSSDRYLGLFNTRDRFPLDLRTPAFASPLVTRATPGHGVEVDVDVRGRARLVLVAEGSEDGTGWDHALWTEPRLVMDDGSERRLTDERWVQATAGWGEVSTERSPSGGPMRVDGRPVRYGIAAHARSLIEYSLPSSASRFRAFAAVDDGALTQPTGATVRFSVYALPPAAPADPAGAPISVSLAELSLSGAAACAISGRTRLSLPSRASSLRSSRGTVQGSTACHLQRLDRERDGANRLARACDCRGRAHPPRLDAGPLCTRAHPVDPTTSKLTLQELIDNQAFGRIFKLLADGATVGYAAVALGFSLEFGGRSAFLDELYVRPSSCGLGIGTLALRQLQEACRGLGARSLALEVGLGNAGAEALYRREGFSTIGRQLMTRLL